MLLRLLSNILKPSARFERLAAQRLRHEFGLPDEMATRLASKAAKIMRKTALEMDGAFAKSYPMVITSSWGRLAPEILRNEILVATAHASFYEESVMIRERERREIAELARTT